MASSVSNNQVIKKKLNAVWKNLPEDLKARTRRIQLFGKLLYEALAGEKILQPDNELFSIGASGLDLCLKYHDIGCSQVSDDTSPELHISGGIRILDEAKKSLSLTENERLLWDAVEKTISGHHKKFNETENLSVFPCICAVCERLDELTTASDMQDNMTFDFAFEDIEKASGVDFSPEIVNGLKSAMPKLSQTVDTGALLKATKGNRELRSMELLFRKVYDFNERRVYGYETNVRLNDKKLGVISQKVFKSIAEKNKKICEIQKWQTEEAARITAELALRQKETGILFIDLSTKSLYKRYFIENLAKTVALYKVPSNQFCFVISESIVLEETDKLQKYLKKLHDFGFLTAIGDFGSEGTNIAVLQALDIDYILVNSSLISGIGTDIKAVKIASSIFEMIDHLDILAVADGVTSKQQAASLLDMGCTLMRGKYFGEYFNCFI